MTTATLPVIGKDEVNAVSNDVLEYLFLFIDRYHQAIASDPTGSVQHTFTIDQNALLAFITLDNQVFNGGFIQLIENGYGSYIFDSPLSEYLRNRGAIQIADIIDKARVIYLQKKAILEREKTLEEFAKLYQEHKGFESLEDQFYKTIDVERAIIKAYIEQHIECFALIK